MKTNDVKLLLPKKVTSKLEKDNTLPQEKSNSCKTKGELQDELLFKNWLLIDEKSKNDYQKIKISLTKQFKNNREGYIQAAQDFVCNITKKARLIMPLKGTYFQKVVWAALCDIPEGKTCSYKDIAIAIGKPKAVRAVANAIGKNPLPGTIPCHRVIHSDGTIGGFRLGIDVKIEMLKKENIIFETSFDR